MSNWKLSKEELKSIESLEMNDFIQVYNSEVKRMSRQLSKVDNDFGNSDRPISQRAMYILRQMTININHISKMFRRKSIEIMKKGITK